MKTNSTNLCDQCSQIEELKQQHQYFVSHLSHEVRNPLTLISSSLQLLEKECPSVKDSSLWTQIREDVDFTICLLQDISSLNNAAKLTLTEFNAGEFLSSLAVSIGSYMEQRNICFSIHLNDSISLVSLHGDRRKLQEALTNLLINAADAVCDPACSHLRTINLTAEYFDKNLHIHVKDNGPGIPDTYLSTLFDPFITHKSTGTGLGLSIVKRVAELHGGSVSVETSCDTDYSYTDFCFRIPAIYSGLSCKS